MKKLGKALGKNLWLIILVLIILTCVGMQFPFNFTYLFKPGVVLPNGGVINSEGRFYESFFMFIEKPNFRKSNDKVSASNPKEVNSYLEKLEQYTKEYDLKVFPEIKSKDKIFPVTSEGKDRILICGGNGESPRDGLFLYNTQGKLLHKSEFFGWDRYDQCFVSARFTDRLWIQIGSSGTSGELFMFEISILGDKIDVKNFGYGIKDEYPTYKIINHRTNPRMVQFRKPFLWHVYWLLRFLLFVALMLVLGLFLISRKL